MSNNNGRFRVHLIPSGHEFYAGTAESLVDAALRNKLVLPYGCRNGSCGECRARLVSGSVTWMPHSDSALTAEAKAQGEILCCSTRAASDVTIETREVREASDVPVRSLRVKVDQLEHLAPDVARVYLKLPEKRPLQYLAGQYVDITTDDAQKRSYSIANSPTTDERLEFHVRHVPGGAFSGQLFTGIKEKSLLRIEGPFGHFYLRDDSPRPLLFVAGGTGFAPVKAIIEYALQRGVARPMWLYWGARAKPDLYLAALPEYWAVQHRHFRYIPVLSDPQPADQWQGRVGFVHDAVTREHPDLSGFDAYVSGPPAMVHAARDHFLAAKLPVHQFFSDAFEPARPAGDDAAAKKKA